MRMRNIFHHCSMEEICAEMREGGLLLKAKIEDLVEDIFIKQAAIKS